MLIILLLLRGVLIASIMYPLYNTTSRSNIKYYIIIILRARAYLLYESVMHDSHITTINSMHTYYSGSTRVVRPRSMHIMHTRS